MKSKKQSEYITEAGKAAMDENKRIKEAAKSLKEKILADIGYNKDTFYTRKEKRAFTRKVKATMFPEKPKVVFTKEQYLERVKAEKAKKIELLNNRTHISQILKEYNKFKKELKKLYNNKLNSKLNEEVESFLANKNSIEDTTKKKYRYTIERLTEDEVPRNTPFLTNYLYAKDNDEAKSTFKEIASKHKDMERFGGGTLTLLKEDGSKGDSLYLSPLAFKDAA